MSTTTQISSQTKYFSSFSEDRIRSYLFGFNGQEKDNELYGEGNAYTAEFWEYDPRIGRRWNLDPVFNPIESPYATFHNGPIFYSDPNGDWPPQIFLGLISALTGRNLSPEEIRESTLPNPIKTYLLTYKAINIELEGRVKVGLGWQGKVNVGGVEVGGKKDFGSVNLGVNSNTGLITDVTQGYEWDALIYGQGKTKTTLLPFDGRNGSDYVPKGTTVIVSESAQMGPVYGEENKYYGSNGEVLPGSDTGEDKLPNIKSGADIAYQNVGGFELGFDVNINLQQVYDAFTNPSGKSDNTNSGTSNTAT